MDVDSIPISRTPIGVLAFRPHGADPIPLRHIIGVGRNYAAHAAEQGADAPERPMLFTKNPAAAILAGEPVVIPAICADREQVDYEGELAVVIGRATRDASTDEAADPESGVVLGYTAANDISARWWQKKGAGGQFCRGKSFDTFCPLGPALRTPGIVERWGGPQALVVRTTLNGEVVQHAPTSEMIFPVAELIAACSAATTLLPGTVILTGTPAGVGMAHDPPRYLRDGDTVTIDLGTADEPVALASLTNPVAAE